jgi:hypothetical protein
MPGHDVVVFILLIVAAILCVIAALFPELSGRLLPLAAAFGLAGLAVALGSPS